MQSKRTRSRGTREEQNALFAALLELHRSKQQRARKHEGDSAYGRVLDHFERRGKRLAGERVVIEQLLGSALRGEQALPPPVHQELVISGALGGSASGRFRVHNRHARAVRVELVTGEPLEGTAPALRFEPPSFDLAPGAAALVRVVADLGAVRTASTCTVPVECRIEGSHDRLWLVIEAHDTPARSS